MAQQTAMQKLLTNLESIGITIPLGVKMVYLRIEKEQIIKTYNDAVSKMDYFIQPEPAEQYYDEKYGK